MADSPRFDFQGLESLVADVLSGGEAAPALDFLASQNAILKSKIPDNPFGCVTADVYPAAQELVIRALALANEFQRRGDTVNEEKALHLRTGPVCYVYGHHRHLVGPAMLEWAECNERMGNKPKAEAIYDAIVKDFLELLDREPGGEADKISLSSLKEAIEGRSQPDLALLERTEIALAKLEA